MVGCDQGLPTPKSLDAKNKVLSSGETNEVIALLVRHSQKPLCRMAVCKSQTRLCQQQATNGRRLVTNQYFQIIYSLEMLNVVSAPPTAQNKAVNLPSASPLRDVKCGGCREETDSEDHFSNSGLATEGTGLFVCLLVFFFFFTRLHYCPSATSAASGNEPSATDVMSDEISLCSLTLQAQILEPSAPTV